MSAAFGGRFVEKNVTAASVVSCLCFSTGLLLTVLSIYSKWVPGIMLSYGCLMGIGLGIGYLAPVKTLMLWFSKQKGLATGLAVAGFGAAKAIASPIMQALLGNLGEGGIYKMFFILAAVYFVMMFAGHLLLKKPDDWHEPQKTEKGQGILAVIKTRPIRNYVGIWLMFYINITCGLALLSQEKAIVKCVGMAAAVALVSTLSAVFNAGGRLFFSCIGDHMKDRNTVYKLIFVLSIAFNVIVLITGGIGNGAESKLSAILVMVLIMVVNAGYGGGFSNVAPLLSDHYGMGSISSLHGITLSAWAFAGLSGNQMATWIVNHFGEVVEIDGHMVNPEGYQMVLYVTAALYLVALLLSVVFVRPVAKEK
jgi:OFA family oxalate/formate antiporter-like MFS transporter